jgi:hypothetical protein
MFLYSSTLNRIRKAELKAGLVEEAHYTRAHHEQKGQPSCLDYPADLLS